jgi:tRNA(His) 5'-end guanylyltransferase
MRDAGSAISSASSVIVDSITRDSLGDRMKRYELAARTTLAPRLPIILRVDGKGFHNWTRQLERPWSPLLIQWMNDAARRLCEEIQGAQFAYVQSDEISVLIHGYKRFHSQAWFDGEVQKIASVGASLAAAVLTLAAGRVAMFDGRVFVMPESEVANYFLWRQQDASRNSIQMLARSLASHKECDRMNQSALMDLCVARGQNWNDVPTHLKRGRCAIPSLDLSHVPPRRRWAIDNEIPIWKGESRAYVEQFLATEPEGSEDSNLSGAEAEKP